MSLYKLVCVFIWASATGTPSCDDNHPCPPAFQKCCSNECRDVCSNPDETTTTSITPISTCSEPLTSGTETSSATSPTTNPTTATTKESTSTSSTIGNTSQSAEPDVAFAVSSRATAAGVSVAVALAVTAFVIVFVLRKREKICFAITKDPKSENPDDTQHISLGRIESKPNAHFQSPQTLGESEAHRYSVLENDGFEQQGNATSSIAGDVHDNFVLQKQQSAIGNGNGMSMNEIHPYFVLEKQGGQPAHEMHSNEARPYFVLEKETTGYSGPNHTAQAHEFEKGDVDTYQEIDSDDTYAGIDDSREENNDYDYTNKAFQDSRTEISDNVYNHLKAAGDEYDHVDKGQNNVTAMENNYDIMSSAARQ